MSAVATDQEAIDRWKAVRQEELDAEAIYRALGRAESDPGRKALFEGIADDEQRHAAHWEEQLRQAKVEPGDARPGQRARILCKLAGDFGATVVVPIMRDREAQSTEAYLDDSGAFAADERRHARALAALVGDARGEPVGRALARLQRGRAAGGNALRAAVLGVNDGLVSNASLVMGVAGAGVASKDILITGVAGLIAGACSMAMGEWISVQSSRELSAKELAIEERHIATEAEVEQAELALVYEQKGLDPARGAEGRRAAVVRPGHRPRHARARGAGDRPRGAREARPGSRRGCRSSSSSSARSSRSCRSCSSRGTRPWWWHWPCRRSACSRSAPRSRSSPGGACSCRGSGSSPSARRRSW